MQNLASFLLDFVEAFFDEVGVGDVVVAVKIELCVRVMKVLAIFLAGIGSAVGTHIKTPSG